ncbi:hypothetical protein APA_4564 [Pseudanabaena sp. lw0831]|nr:hypothetical protein APA_4564 [Pseudanabaena sp. lw0831]
MGEIVGFGLGELVGEGLGVAVGVGIGVGETFVVSFAGIEKLLLPAPELPQAVNKPVAIAVRNKIDSLRERNIMLSDVTF